MPLPETLKPDQALRKFSSVSRTPAVWPAWILVRWEESFLCKRFLQQLWEMIESVDSTADRVVLYPKDAASVQSLFQEMTASSLFSSARCIIAHVPRPVKRSIPIGKLARAVMSIPEKTVVVLAVDAMAKPDEEMEALAKATASASRPGMKVEVWRPYKRSDYVRVGQEILGGCGVRADVLTLNFWLDRVGLNLERLQAEAKRLKIQSPDDEVTQERLEEVFEVPHVHDETLWDALRLLLHGDLVKASAALKALLQSSDVNEAAAALSRAILCAYALSNAKKTERRTEDVFLLFDVKGRRRQEKIVDIASRMGVSSHPLDDLAGRLLSLELSIKQSKTAPGRQEIFLRTLLALGNEPQPAA